MTGQKTSDGLMNDTAKQEGTGMPAAVSVSGRQHRRVRRASRFALVHELRLIDGLDRLDPATREMVERATLDRYGLD